jgi:hypothetical protein
VDLAVYRPGWLSAAPHQPGGAQVTAVAEQYATAPELLRRLASRPDRLVHNGDSDLAGLMDALAVAAQACEQVDEADQAREDAEQECREAMLHATQLWSLLERAADTVDALIAHDDGGAWETLTLAYELRQAVEVEPDALGARLLGELYAARVALRAAGALAASVHRGDGEAAGQCLATFQQAIRAWQAVAGTRQPAGEVGVVAGEESR